MTETLRPEDFAAEVAALHADLAEVAPRLLPILERYDELERTFNARFPGRPTDDEWRGPWTESGARALHDQLWDLAERIAEALGMRLIP
jgi:hypothetical protein